MKTLWKSLVILITFALVFITYYHPLVSTNVDLGRHIKMGEIIFTTHTVPTTNVFSYTYADFQLVNSHWLSEVIFYLVFHVFGYFGLLVLATACGVGAFGILFFFLHKKVHLSSLMLMSLLILPILSDRSDVRPEIFSFLFTTIFLVILSIAREKKTRLLWLLPVIEAFWVNIHIYFIVGIILVGSFFLEYLFEHRNNLRQALTSPLALVFVLTCIGALLTPFGIKGFLFPFTFSHNYGFAIAENQNIFWFQQMNSHATVIFFLEILMLLYGGFLLFFLKKTRPTQWLLGIIFAVLAVTALRNLPLFCYVAFIPLVLWIDSTTSKFVVGKARTIVVYTLLIALSIFVGSFMTSVYGFGFQVRDDNKEAVDFYLTHHIDGPVFNNFDIGSYLDYRLYPQQKVFVDTRPEAYPASFFTQTYSHIGDRATFAVLDNKYHFNSAIFSHTDQYPAGIAAMRLLANDPHWAMVYLDDSVVIFVKKNAANESVIKQYEITQARLRLDTFHYAPELSYRYVARFLELIQWKNAEVHMFVNLVQQHPTSCFYLKGFAMVYNGVDQALYNKYIGLYNSRCF